MSRIHEQFEHMLPDYLRGVLEDRDAEQLRRHLDLCPLCQGRLDSLKTVFSMLDASEQGVPAGYFQTVLPRFRARLDSRRRRSFGGEFAWTRWMAPVGAVVVAAGLLATLEREPSSKGGDGLRAVAGDMSANELAEIVMQEMEGTMASGQPEEVLALAVPQKTLSRQLLEHIGGEDVLEELAPLQTVDDLGNEELDLILGRLEQRKFL